MNFRNKTKNFIYNLKLNEVISTIIGLSFSYFYLIYPVWLLPGSLLFDFLTFLSLWILNIILVYITSSFIKRYEKEIKSILYDIKNYLKISAKILIILFIILIIIFFEYIFFTPLQSRGDEPAHISRIINYIFFWTLYGLVPPQISFLMIIIGLVFVSFFFFQISKIPRKMPKKGINFLRKKLNLLLITGPILLILLILIFAKNLELLGLDYTAFTRYGPIHTSLYAIPVFLFGWSYIIIPIWRIMNIITSLGTLFLSSYLINLLFKYNQKRHSNERNISPIRLFLSYLLVLPLFFIPAIILFTFSVWLTTGVLFFSILSFVFILWFLIEPSNRKKKVLLFFNAIIFGYGMLWKEILLLQPIIFVIFIVLKNILHYFKRLHKKPKMHYLKPILNFAILISIIGIPFRFFSIIFDPRPSSLRFNNIFSLKYFDYFYRCYLEVGFMAVILYISLLLLIIVAIFKKQYVLLYFPLAFFMWYTFFYIMIFVITTISMKPTRVMTIPILILVLSFAILISKFRIPITFTHQKYSKKINNFIRMIIIIVILIPSSIIGYYHAQDTRRGLNTELVGASRRLPYKQVANYILTRWDNNSEKIYYYYGPNSLRLYFYLEGFRINWEEISSKEEESPLTLPIFWKSTKEFSTVENFLNYSFQNNIRFIALPDKSHCLGHIQPILEDLISLGLNDTIEMVRFTYYESDYYVWDLRSYK